MQYRGLNLRFHHDQWYFEDAELILHQDPQVLAQKEAAFMSKYHLVPAHGGMSIVRIMTGHTIRRKIQGMHRQWTINDDMNESPKGLKCVDHPKMFYDAQRRSYILTVQPYSCYLEKFQDLEQFCQERALACWISYEEAWWYPGRTPLIAIGRAEVMAEIFGLPPADSESAG